MDISTISYPESLFQANYIGKCKEKKMYEKVKRVMQSFVHR